jgi:hypothetical protein
MARKSKLCPKCGSSQTIPIIYGYPSAHLELEDEKGNIMLGGCEVYDDMPEFYCKDCDNQFNSNDVKKQK